MSTLLPSLALCLLMLGSSAYLCAFYIRLQKQKPQQKPAQRKPLTAAKQVKTMLLEEWEDQICEYTKTDDSV